MGKSILLHPKHGVSPTMALCFYCGEPSEILLVGQPRGKVRVLADPDGKMPRDVGAVNYEPCQKCKEYMKQGIIVISVKDGETDWKNPYRTGKWVVVSEDFIKRVAKSPVKEDILKRRVAFIEDSVWEKIGLPSKEEIEKGEDNDEV